MISDLERALLANLWLSPDVSHWLIYADWLIEQGQVGYAEIIQNRVERLNNEGLPRNLTDNPPPPRTRARRRPVKTTFPAIRVPELPGWLDYLWSIRLQIGKFLERHFQGEVWSWREQRLHTDAIIALMVCPKMAEIRTLNLRYNRLSDRGIQAIGECPYLQQLRELDLSWNPLGGSIHWLTESPVLQGLEQLNLNYAGLTDVDVDHLLHPANEWSVTYLWLVANPVATLRKTELERKYLVEWR
ncbi:hypothetical protein [Tuwongella immobilis]|uniref:Repeat-companion domain-containing protein:: LRR_6: LRR_6 n=1 Tax=Tuwongella immobilis TaxID=692036 RepID=A0A6C2YS63_9BACT|nr:hypothetical protein [Tuwongella immobilis]VIP03815.1 repeat-companion domain-containing protein : : LRR_6: LRR_6 [Tuwongella immobilis]VTS04997.1 repeat-companion domain-containing protein : : LRR_6: LRR_6 [Tuwongella immobilis]